MGTVRLLFALFVVIWHAGPLFGYQAISGTLAIKAFFVISGFYMTLILSEKYIDKNGRYSLFLTNRFFRIYPAYWLILLVTICLSYFWFYNNQHYAFAYRTYQNTPFLYTSPLNIIQDFTLLIRNDYFQLNDNLHQILIISQAWTLVVELLFYIIAPFIVKKIRIVLILLILSTIARYLVLHFALTNHIPVTDRFLPSELCFFLLGSVSYYIYDFIKNRKISHKVSILITTIFIILTVTYAYLPFNTRIHWLTLQDVYYVFILTLTIPFLFLFSKKSRVDRFIGELSYPVYLSHSLIILTLTNLSIRITKSYFTLVAILLTLIASAIIYYVLDRPIDKWRQRRLILLSNSKKLLKS